MKYNFPNDTKYDSDYFLKLALVAKHNSIVLKDTAKLTYQNTKNRIHGLSLQYTSFEELQKGIFCLLVHRGFMKKEQIIPVFSRHEAKIILFETIFKSKFGLVIQNDEFFLDGKSLKKLDFEQIIKKNQKFGKEYMNKRNDCLYVRPDASGYHSPVLMKDIEKQWAKLNDEKTALNFLFEFIWVYDFKDFFCTHFNYYKLASKDHHVVFVGTKLKERKNWRPSWVDKLQKELQKNYKKGISGI